MTRDEILAMEPGRELDALVAERVMGKPKPTVIPRSDEKFLETWDDWGGAWLARFKGDNEIGQYYALPFSTNISKAWEVVEKIDAGSYRWRLASKHCRSGHVWWTATLDKYLGAVNGWKEMVYAPGDTAPEAICKAALLAVMEN